jgi:hypothetical protein
MIANETFPYCNRQHLYRVHCRPEFICRRCQQEFSTDELLDAHSGQIPICDPGEAVCTERMTKAQEQRIKKRTRGMTPEVNWFAIWQVLFPDQKPAVSPCGSSLKQLIGILAHVWQILRIKFLLTPGTVPLLMTLNVFQPRSKSVCVACYSSPSFSRLYLTRLYKKL